VSGTYKNRALRLQADVGEILSQDEWRLTPEDLEILRKAMEIGRRLARW
jgi:hypothetical protein